MTFNFETTNKPVDNEPTVVQTPEWDSLKDEVPFNGANTEEDLSDLNTETFGDTNEDTIEPAVESVAESAAEPVAELANESEPVAEEEAEKASIVYKINKFTKEAEIAKSNPHFLVYQISDSKLEAVTRDDAVPALVDKIQHIIDNPSKPGNFLDVQFLVNGILKDENGFSDSDKAIVKAVTESPEYQKAKLISAIRTNEARIAGLGARLKAVEADFNEQRAKNNNFISKFFNRETIGHSKFRYEAAVRDLENCRQDIKEGNVKLGELNKSMLGKESMLGDLVKEWRETDHSKKETASMSRREKVDFLLENSDEFRQMKEEAERGLNELHQKELTPEELKKAEVEYNGTVGAKLRAAVEYLSLPDKEKEKTMQKMAIAAHRGSVKAAMIRDSNYNNEELAGKADKLEQLWLDIMANAYPSGIVNFEGFYILKQKQDEAQALQKELDAILG